MTEKEYAPPHAAMNTLIEKIQNDIFLTAPKTGLQKLSARVIQAIRQVPRHLFVPPSQVPYAYEDTALPILEGQTISQPFIVALMTELLQVQPTDKILEIGTGSGYQAAILAHLAAQVFTVEVFPSLTKKAQQQFNKLNYHNIYCKVGDGAMGWPKNQPYNKIIVTAAAQKMPVHLLAQLAPQGIMVLPLGRTLEAQTLTVIEKDNRGHTFQKEVLPVRFVPFI